LPHVEEAGLEGQIDAEVEADFATDQRRMTEFMIETLPERLRAIHDEVCRRQIEESNLETLEPTWAAHVAQAKQQIRDVHVKAEGEVLYLGNLSPGCQACKDGTWDCVFTTMRCNLNCEFCYSPHAIPRDYAGSGLGATREQIAEHHARTQITGMSFSGGEPFVDAQGLFEWIAWFTKRYPERYYWVYTNGLLADEGKLRQLAGLGVGEVRFNLAASGYDHPTVLQNLAAAIGLIPNVTVEIPAIPAHGAKLFSCLADWASLGVRFLNLHELMYEPGTNSASLPGARQAIVTADGHRSEINPESRGLTLAVMRQVQEEALPLAVNDCSLQSKIRQVRGRRRCLAPLTKTAHEKLVNGEALESYGAYLEADELFFCHPDSLGEMRRRFPNHQFVRLVRTAPLSIRDRGKWITFEAV
jgi:pyruvate formate-lyase activating enzyme-like uncharacterized protein